MCISSRSAPVTQPAALARAAVSATPVAPELPTTAAKGAAPDPNQFAFTKDYNAQNPAGYIQKTAAAILAEKRKASMSRYRIPTTGPDTALAQARADDAGIAAAPGRSSLSLVSRMPGILPQIPTRGGVPVTTAPITPTAPVAAKKKGRGSLAIQSGVDTTQTGLNIPQ